MPGPDPRDHHAEEGRLAPFEQKGDAVVPSYAVTLTSRLTRIDGILLILDDRQEADEIAGELIRKGHQVIVREVPPTLGRSSSTGDESGARLTVA
jgi:hypothetical protein